MENISLLKERWFKKEVERLASEGISKADIARALDIKPQYLNSVLNGSRGLADTFLDKFIEAYDINQFDLSSRASDSAMSLRLMDKLDQKEAQIDHLQSELRTMEKELAVFKAKHEPQAEPLKRAPKSSDPAKPAFTKQPSSPNVDNVTSVIVP